MSVPIRVIIVDDEPLARRGIRARLNRAGGIEIVRECGSGRDAIKVVRALAPDLVFLDVQMPGVDGFGVVQEIGADAMPITVFVTAFDEHALRAFDAQALDYLLKPIDDDRFGRTLERVRQRVQERRESAVGRQVVRAITGAAAVDPGSNAAGRSDAVVVRDGRLMLHERGRVLFVDVDEVDWVEANGDYVRIYLGTRSALIRETMKAMERALDANTFVRIHRSTIVNVQRIVELRPHTAREWTVVLRNGRTLRLSRRYRAHVDSVLRAVRRSNAPA